jgi:hypothetical protein
MLNFSSDIAALPERLRLAIREQQADAEILIAWVQLAIVLLFSLVYAAAPKAFPEMSRFEPVPLVLGAILRSHCRSWVSPISGGSQASCSSPPSWWTWCCSSS